MLAAGGSIKSVSGVFHDVLYYSAPGISDEGWNSVLGQAGCDTLILLVGSNPLPNYIAARVLRPQRILMLYTSGPTGTERVMKGLRSVFSARLHVDVLPPCSVRRSDAREVRDIVLKYVNRDSHLNYTGGTKMMAVQARLAFREAFRALGDGCGREDSHASYVDEERGAIVFDDGSEIPTSQIDLGLSLEDLAMLHGVSIEPTARTRGGPTSQDVHEVLRRVILGNRSIRVHLAEKGSWLRQVSFAKALSDPFIPEHHNLRFSVKKIPDVDWTEERLALWQRFLSNGWLELWVSDLIQQVTGKTPEWSINCELKPVNDEVKGRWFEVDLALILGRRLHVISCTTNANEDTCKMKLFEVGYRARQLGGDLARAALVSFLDGVNSNTGQPKVEMVQQDTQSLWNAPNKPRVFGMDDIRKWFGCHAEPDLTTLKQWLDG